MGADDGYHMPRQSLTKPCSPGLLRTAFVGGVHGDGNRFKSALEACCARDKIELEFQCFGPSGKLRSGFDFLDDALFQDICHKALLADLVVVVDPSCTRPGSVTSDGVRRKRSLDIIRRVSRTGARYLHLGKEERHAYQGPVSEATSLESILVDTKASTIAAYRCHWADATEKIPLRIVTNYDKIEVFGKSGLPEDNNRGDYVGPLLRDCGHDWHDLVSDVKAQRLELTPGMCSDMARLAFHSFDLGPASEKENSVETALHAVAKPSPPKTPTILPRVVGKCGAASILQDIVSILSFPDPKQNHALGKSACAGLSAFFKEGSLSVNPVINELTRNNRQAIQRLNEAIKRDQGFPKDFQYSSMHINSSSTPSKPHEDRHNLRLSIIVGLGRYEGGGLRFLRSGVWCSHNILGRYLLF